MSNFSDFFLKVPLILTSARKLEQLAELNIIPLGGLKTIAEYEFQLQFNYSFNYNSITIFLSEVVNIYRR